jgi:hypothetical protein
MPAEGRPGSYGARVAQPGLKRFWFEFDVSLGDALRGGCGVTAVDREDALGLIRERVRGGAELPAVTECIEDVDVSKLDPRHVLPNLVMPTIWRGVWFPQGYADWNES